MRLTIAALLAGAGFLITGRVEAQHLWWDKNKQNEATCLYGEVTILATHPGIYYCGANWHPGEPAGGYCGIQHNGPKERRTIFSIWDTAAKLHPKVTLADPKTVLNRFGGKGEAPHAHGVGLAGGRDVPVLCPEGTRRQQGTTDTHYYVYDRNMKTWRHSATITSPNGDKKSEISVATIGGGLNSFLEDFQGKDRDVPKLALYRLWLGTKVDEMKCLTHARGDGTWGQLHDAYFLAQGKDLDALYDKLKTKYGVPVLGQKDKKLDPISDKPLPAELLKELKDLPCAEKVMDK